MKKNKLFMALMAGTIVISGCAAKTEKKEENKKEKINKNRKNYFFYLERISYVF